ncbi:hypothetical protein ACWEFJ_37020, partial [Actinosynnema sp. NPDC004786]
PVVAWTQVALGLAGIVAFATSTTAGVAIAGDEDANDRRDLAWGFRPVAVGREATSCGGPVWSDRSRGDLVWWARVERLVVRRPRVVGRCGTISPFEFKGCNRARPVR